MRKIIFLFFLYLILLNVNSLFSQYVLDSLVPQPRQAYIRQIYSAVFSFYPGLKIYINQNNPSWKAAYELNKYLKTRAYDTLEIKFWNEQDTLVNGVVIGSADPFLNRLFSYLPDQRISVSDTYPGKEGYIVDVMPGGVIIAGSDEQGIIYGINTLFQLLDKNGQNNFIFACRIVDAPEFPMRWFYYSTNVLVGSNIDKAKPIWKNAADLRLNAVCLTDSKFSRPSSLPQRYFDSLISLKNFAEENHLDINPCIFPFGYSGGILFFDPNLASGLPVFGQKFIIEADTARLIPSSNVSLANGGFENYNGNNFSGFRFIDKPGQISFVDNDIKHSGNASIRFENFAEHNPDHGHGRICFRAKVSPYKLYHLSGWVRTENIITTDDIRVTAIGNKRHCSYYTVDIPSTTEWKRVDVTFNSLENDTVSVYWGVWGAKSGKIWWDDLVFEELAFVNMIKREGAPINASHIFLGLAYIEGQDYDTLRDPLMGNYKWSGNYDIYHAPPTFRIKPGGNLHNGDSILISYYHTTLIHSGQVMITMSDPKVYEIIEREFKILDSVLQSDTYFMQHDEIRVMNYDYGDQSRGIQPSEILADNVNKCVEIIKKYSPDADIWVWTDMFDEYHNAVEGPFYLVNGNLRGSADKIPNTIGMMNWNGRSQNNIVHNSLDFFEEKGFRQMSAPYYDRDENQIRVWKEWTRGTNSFKGMMYTTWAARYTHLEPFAEYAWNHAPHIFHYPPFSIDPVNDIGLTLRITGDKWDNGWSLENAQILYRTDPGMRFTVIDLDLEAGIEKSFIISLSSNNKWLQYFITARDNRGWYTRIPFGQDQYFELGDMPVSINEQDQKKNLVIKSLIPNPVGPDGHAVLEWTSAFNGNAGISVSDILGRNVISLDQLNIPNVLNRAVLDFKNINQGIYFLKIRCGNEMNFIKIIK